MGYGLDAAATGRLIDAAEVLREDSGDVRWLVDAFAVRLEELLPHNVEVRRDGVVRRRVRSISLCLGSRYFECRPHDDRGLETFTASVGRDIVGRRRRIPVAAWVTLLERTLEQEMERTGEDRDALGRLLP